jgi:hypothetical protein
MGPGAKPFFHTDFVVLNLIIQSVLDAAASSGAPDTFIQTVLTKLSLLSNDANSSLDVAAYALQVHIATARRRVLPALAAVNTQPQEALGRCAASIEGSAQDVLMLRDEITAAAAAADTGATSDLQDLKLLSSAQSRLSNIVQARPASHAFILRIIVTILQILTQSEQLQTKMLQLEQAVAQGSLQHVADLAAQCRALLAGLDSLPSLHLMRARIDEATLSNP